MEPTLRPSPGLPGPAEEPTLRTSLGLPVLRTLADLAGTIGLPLTQLERLLIKPDYITVRLPKRGSGYRTIDIPSPAVKAVQAWILRAILSPIALDPAATAFRIGYSLLENVSPHVNQPFVWSMDVVDFFGSIRIGRIRQFFESLGYPKEISPVLASLCCFNQRLPQGAVTSPTLSNLVCVRMDRDIREYSVTRNVMYTRYADDITLSARSPGALRPVLQFVRSVLKREGFREHPNKTRVMRPGQKHEITGLIITDNNEISIGRKTYRKLRTAIDRLEKGRELEGFDHGKESILGWLRYLKSVDQSSYDRLTAYWNQKIGPLP